jgi:hypothetical protein
MRRFLGSNRSLLVKMAIAASAISLVSFAASGALASGRQPSRASSGSTIDSSDMTAPLDNSNHAQVPNVTGAWTPTTGGCDWHLAASGPGFKALHATWSGACSSGGHSALEGVFDGSLSGNTYTGNFQISEGSTHVTGTMSFRIDSPTQITVTLRATGSSTAQTITLRGHGHAAVTPVKIDITFHTAHAVTAPQTGGGVGVPSSVRCPLKVPADASGTIEAQITPRGAVEGSGVVADRPHDTRCHSPGVKLEVDHISVVVIRPSHVIRATLSVHIVGASYHQPGQCLVGTPGTIQATYDDTKVAANGLNEDDALKIGPWGGRGCNADNHVITDDMSNVPALAKGGTYVRATIACLGRPDTPAGPGYSPRNCGA